MAINREDYNSIIEQSTSRLPYWARSTNPIVRRHLGLNWRTLPPELRPILQIVGGWGLVLLSSIIIPGIADLALMLFLASFLALPVGLVYYGRVLVQVATYAAQRMQDEIRNDTMTLLRATPMSLEQILLGKVAAALWRQMDDLVLLVQGVAVFAPPILYSLYATVWSPERFPVIAQFIIMVAIVVSLLRLILEPIMIGVLAVLVGAVVPNRSTAVITTLVLGAFYFLLLNLLSALTSQDRDGFGVILVDFVLPLLLPAVLSWVMLRLTRRIISRD